ncbi:MAG: DNA replication/repair protein RecF [Bacilli bacterium]|nr:DNA replication/repair protein RecF [Bacilli bacterium]
MYLKNIKIQNFRNYDNLSLEFEKGLNIIYGNNGQGKTNLLESLYVLGMTKSHRSYIDNKLIKDGKNSFKINGNLLINHIKSKLELSYDGKVKLLKIDNNDIKRVSDYVSLMNVIIFYPDDLNLIKGSPFERRRFLNSEVSQLSGEYLNVLNDYNKLLKMRNDYLKNKQIDNNYLNILTDYLIDKAVIIYKMRYKFVEKLNKCINDIYKDLSNIEGFNIVYKTSFLINDFNKEALKTELKHQFEKNKIKELKNKITLIGPHRDDLEFLIKNDNIKNFGSQGQQRMAILALKLAEIEIINQYKGSYPILLLDDVFSELDRKKRGNLLKYLENDIQTIITTTDLTNISKKIRDKSKLINIENAKIKKIVEVIDCGK